MLTCTATEMIVLRAESAQTNPEDTNGVPIIIGCSEELVSKWYSRHLRR